MKHRVTLDDIDVVFDSTPLTKEERAFLLKAISDHKALNGISKKSAKKSKRISS